MAGGTPVESQVRILLLLAEGLDDVERRGIVRDDDTFLVGSL
jgi:hypothetical protein